MSRKKKPSDELRELIAQAGMSQRLAAEALGVSRRCIEHWVSDDGKYVVPKMALIAMRWIIEHEAVEAAQ